MKGDKLVIVKMDNNFEFVRRVSFDHRSSSVGSVRYSAVKENDKTFEITRHVSTETSVVFS